MSGTLLDGHDALLLDLDGTVCRGPEIIDGAKESLDAVHQRRVPIRYVTNNASKSAQAVAEHLTGMGLPAEATEVSTSAQAGAAMLAEMLPSGARVLVVGTPALESEVDGVGLVPVRKHSEKPVAVVQGHSTETGWHDLAEACLALRSDALWIASNEDVALPTERGLLPGNGAMVAALRAATGRSPLVAGKPQRPILDGAMASAGAKAPLVVGDRLETDIAGAVNADMPGLLVLTGGSTPGDLLSAPPALRPTYVAADLRALHRPAAESSIGEPNTWKVSGPGESLALEITEGVEDPDPLGALRALCAHRWAQGSGAAEVRAEDGSAEKVLRCLGLG